MRDAIRRIQDLMVARRRRFAGWCPICAGRTVFHRRGEWLRDDLRCTRCDSIPRWRALVHVLELFFPTWRLLRIHESSPGGAASAKLQRECRHYLATHFFPNVPIGESFRGFRCEDLERQTFPNDHFDLVITQDVFEHVLDPARGFSEVARTLKPGGAHVFTVPWYHWQATAVRAVREAMGIKHLKEAEYHGNPIDSTGSLVVTDWGWDLPDFIYRWTSMTTTAVRILDRQLGIAGEFIEVFISRKPPAVRREGR